MLNKDYFNVLSFSCYSNLDQICLQAGFTGGRQKKGGVIFTLQTLLLLLFSKVMDSLVSQLGFNNNPSFKVAAVVSAPKDTLLYSSNANFIVL